MSSKPSEKLRLGNIEATSSRQRENGKNMSLTITCAQHHHVDEHHMSKHKHVSFLRSISAMNRSKMFSFKSELHSAQQKSSELRELRAFEFASSGWRRRPARKAKRQRGTILSHWIPRRNKNMYPLSNIGLCYLWNMGAHVRMCAHT